MKNKIMFMLTALVLIISAMFAFWHIELKKYKMPVQHTTKIESGEVSLEKGEIREIVIEGQSGEVPVEVDLSIMRVDGTTAWEKSYDNVVFTGTYQTLDAFDIESPLVLGQGIYYVRCYINKEINSTARIKLIEYNGSFRTLYVWLCALLILGTTIVFLAVYKTNLSPEKIYIVLMLIFGIIYNFVQPPLSAPDEESHFLEAYKLSSKMMFQESYDENNCLMIRADDYNSIFYLHNAASISEWYLSFERGNTQQMVPAPMRSTVAAKAPHAYLAPAIGITIARHFNFGGHTLLILGRLFNLILYTLLVAAAIKIIPYGKWFCFIFGLLPETIHLFVSYSYDGVTFALCMLIMAYFLYLYYEADVIKMRQLITFLLLVLLMIPVKVVYFLYIFLILLLPKEKVLISRRQMIVGILCMLFVVAAGLGINRNPILSLLGNLSDDSVKMLSNGESRVTLGYMIHNPFYTLYVYLNTIFKHISDGGAAILGHINGRDRYGGFASYLVPEWMIIMLIFLLCIGLEDTKCNKISMGKRILTGMAGIVCYLLILTAMYFDCTPASWDTIGGFQGRYLLPIFMLLPVMVRNRWFQFNGNKRLHIILGIGFVDLMFAFLVFVYYSMNYFA